MSKTQKCLICGTDHVIINGSFVNHIKNKHNLSKQQYYDKFFKSDPNEGICPVCGNTTPFRKKSNKYNIFCSMKCVSRSNETISKRKQTKLKRYGNENYRNEEKIKKTKLERYGDENYYNGKKISESLKEKWNNDSELIIKKMKQTKLEKYGDENYVNVAKGKQTKLERYGDENYVNVAKGKQTKLEKYGDENYRDTDKLKQTLIKRYGSASYVNHEKRKQTNLERYGDENYCNMEKINRTKRERGTFSTSGIEEKLNEYFINENINFERQYKSEEYPFRSDFYLVDNDLYVEIQGYWTHGKEPFDSNNENHIKKLDDWKKRSLTKDQYKNAINTWTKMDPLKLETAMNNRLNFLSIYSCDFETCKKEIINKIKELNDGRRNIS